MKKTTTLDKLLFYRIRVAVGAAALLSGTPNPVNATQTVRELWDGSGKTPLVGHGTDSSSVGLDNSTTWVVSPPGNTTLSWDSTWDLFDYFGIDGNTVLPASGGSGGTFAYYSGGNMSTLLNPATSLPYGDYYSQCYARRALDTNAYINFKSNGTYYFSVRVVKNISWWGWNGDNAGGIGFASSGATNADFIGVGTTRNSFSMEDSTDASSTCYITTGTLDQAGVSSHPDDSGGLYYPRAAGAANLMSDLGGLLVGQLTTTASGASTLSVKLYTAYSGSYPSDPSSINWNATYSFTETNIMTQLLVWQYGTGPSVQDALRVGTTWADVMGLEVIGEPKATPGSTVYAGTTVTLSQLAGLNSGTYPMSFQWYSNSVPLSGATNSTLVLTNPTTDFTAAYSIVAGNFFGALTNVVHVTVNPAVSPFFTALPASITRSVGGTATFTVGVDGTPPYGLQLKHAGTNLPGVVSQLSLPGTATLQYGPITLADAGQYSVMATNLFGTTNCQSATLTVSAPASGSFEAAAAAAGAAAFWRLTESTNDLTTNGVPLHEFMSGLDGNCPDTNNMSFGLAGPNFPGFAGLTSIQVRNNGLSSQINLGGMKQYSNTMTMLFWMNASYLGGNALMLDTGTAQGNGPGDGPYFGIDYRGGSLGSQWGPGASMWNSGITLPLNQWIMVALVVEPNETTIYASIDPYTIQSATRSSIVGTNYSNTSGSLPNGRLALGRTDYAWAQYNNSWADHVGQFSDAAVFNKALTPSAITNLVLAGVGLQVSGTPDGGGNLSLNWMPVLTLQEANSVTGPWTDVSSSPTPPYSVPISTTTAQHFYRVKR